MVRYGNTMAGHGAYHNFTYRNNTATGFVQRSRQIGLTSLK